jgi:iron complex transport system substrate-binding protein
MLRIQKFLQFITIALISFIVVTACQSPTPVTQTLSTSANCKIIEHDIGETEICDQPQKIAVLGPYALDLTLSLGMQPAGYAEFSKENLGETVESIPFLGDRVTTQPVGLGLRNSPSLEALVKLKPDLIIGEHFHESFYSQFSQIAPTVLFSGQEDHWKQSLVKLAKGFNQEEKAQEILDNYQQRIVQIKEEYTEVIAANSNVLMMYGSELPKNIRLETEDTFAGHILEDLGFDMVYPTDAVSPYDDAPISFEMLPSLAADLIFVTVTDHLRDDALAYIENFWKTNPITKEIPATKNEQVYFIDYYIWGSNIRGAIASDLLLDELEQILLTLQSRRQQRFNTEEEDQNGKKPPMLSQITEAKNGNQLP